jgi:ribosomal protein S18 acetylase RimI-like enzyme
MRGRRADLDSGVIVRDALPSELPAIGDLRVGAYQAGNFLSDASNYGEVLRTLGFDGTGQILAAVGAAGDLLGTVMLQFWPHGEHVVRGPDEAEVRALAVAPQAQGQGVGRALLRASIDRATGRGLRHLVLCTQTTMAAAQRLYTSAGFVRLPDRDWDPVPGFTLLAYGLPLARSDRAGAGASGRL